MSLIYNWMYYIASGGLILIGMYIILVKTNLIKIIIGLNFIDTGVNILLVCIGYVKGSSSFSSHCYCYWSSCISFSTFYCY